mgnify:CR=1 FL=1
MFGINGLIQRIEVQDRCVQNCGDSSDDSLAV